MANNEKIGKVIKIIDKFNIVVNIGSDDKLNEHEKLEIYQIGPEIFDGEISLGTLDVIKATLMPKNIFPKMSLCTNNEYRKRTITKPNTLSAILQQPEKEEIEEIIPLKISSNSSDIDLSELMTIKVGDLVRFKS